MNGPRKTDVGNPAHWLEFACDDLAAVRVLLTAQTAYWVARGKLAEAFEKALKADLIRRGWRLEKTHDMQRLLDELAVSDPHTVDRLQPYVDELAESYTESRYRGSIWMSRTGSI